MYTCIYILFFTWYGPKRSREAHFSKSNVETNVQISMMLSYYVNCWCISMFSRMPPAGPRAVIRGFPQ